MKMLENSGKSYDLGNNMVYDGKYRNLDKRIPLIQQERFL